MTKELNPKEQMFVAHYLVSKNATEAAKKAGYADTTADKKAPLWVGKSRNKSPKPHVWDAVREKLDEIANELEIEAKDVIKELAAIGFANMGDYLTITANGDVALDFTKLKDADLRAVTKFTQRHIHVSKDDAVPPIVETKFELASKVTALTKLGEHLGLFKQKIEHDVSDGLADLLTELDGKSRGLPSDE